MFCMAVRDALDGGAAVAPTAYADAERIGGCAARER